MSLTSTSVFQITQFHNCDVCISKVRSALGKFDDLKLIGMDPENGIFSISSSTIDHERHEREAIRAELEHQIHRKTTILLPNDDSSRQGIVDFKDMVGMLMTLPEAERIRRVKCRQDVLRVDYYEKPLTMISKVAADHSVVPPPPTTSAKPSAPPMPARPECYVSNGYPVYPHSNSTTRNRKDDFSDCACIIM